MSDSNQPTGEYKEEVIEYTTEEIADPSTTSEMTEVTPINTTSHSVAFKQTESSHEGGDTAEKITSTLYKSDTMNSTGSAILNEDIIVARKVAEAKRKAEERKAARERRDAELKKANFFTRLRKKPNIDDDDSEDGEDKDKKNEKKVTIANLFRFATPLDKLLILIGSISSVALGLSIPIMTIIFSDIMGVFFAYPTQQLTDPEGAKDKLDHDIRIKVLYFTFLGVAAFVVAYLKQSIWMFTGENQTSRMRRDYYASIVRQEISWFDATPTGDLTSRITGDINLIQEGISEKFGSIIQHMTTFLSGFIIAFFKGWRMALVLLSVLPLLAITGALMGRAVSKEVQGGQDAYAKAGSVAEEVLAGIKTVSAFGGQEREIKRYESKLDIAFAAGNRKAVVMGVSIGSMMLVMFCSYGLGFWFGAHQVAQGSMTGTDVLNVFFALIVGAMFVGLLATPLSSLQTAQGAAYRIFEVIDRKSAIDYTQEQGTKPEKISGRIEFRDIDFTYPSRPDVQVLHNFSLTIEPGQTVALVGSSGSGKSTIVSLIERFYAPDNGSIEIDGLPIEDINLRQLRRHIGLVGQEPVLFQTTIKQNILWGAYDDADNVPSDEEVVAACRASNVHDFIVSLPRGYDTPVGEKGALLSGGQKQRIAIARALIRNPSILLLDEATSALDTESERLVQNALDNASSGRTTIVIAHRLSTIRNADRIVVMNRGKIVEIGTHSELIDRGGLYNKLVKAQELRTEKDRDLAQDAMLATDTDLDTDTEEVGESKMLLHATHKTHSSLDRVKSQDTTKSMQDVAEIQKQLKEKRAKQSAPFMRVARLNAPEYKLTILGTIGAMVEGATMPLFSLIFSEILNVFTIADTDEMKRRADFWALMFVVLGVVTFFAVFGRTGVFIMSGERLIRRIRKMAFTAMLRQEMGFFDEPINSTGILCAKLSTEADMVNGISGRLGGTIVQLLTTTVVGLSIAFANGWKLTLVVLSCVPVLAVLSSFNMRIEFGLNQKTKKAYERSANVAVESVENIRTVVSLGREETFKEMYQTSITGPHKLSIRTAFGSALTFASTQAMMFLVYSLALYYGSRLVLDGSYSIDQMMKVMFAVIFSAMNAGEAAGLAPDYAKAKIAAIDIFELLDRQSAIDPTEPDGKVADPFTGKSKAQDVHFRYPARRNVRVLRGLDMEIQSGQTVALVGSSGCGKSTMIGLIQRFYDVDSGHVTVDEVNTNEWQLQQLRSNLALVGQEPVLFDLSIRDNIAYGKPDATDEEVHQAARDANIYDFIASLPDGFDTGVGERGTQLSGGQKQRIAIARAIIRNPRLLLLDEATSALDSESEKIVQDALDRASHGRTTITIAHRLSTIQDADLIYVLKDGKVVESGKHMDLIKNKGLYYALVQKQMLGKQEDE